MADPLAVGETLPATQNEIRFDGHAFQCRIYAENPEKGFLHSPGMLVRFEAPVAPWIRNDVGFRQGDLVTPYYDPLLAKLIVWGPDRAQSIERMKQALTGFSIDGIANNLAMHARVFAHDEFVRGNLSTGFLREHLALRA